MAKHRRDKDIPPSPNQAAANQLQLTAYQQLQDELRCKAHQGHCFISCQAEQNNQHHFNYEEMSLWATKTVSSLDYCVRIENCTYFLVRWQEKCPSTPLQSTSSSTTAQQSVCVFPAGRSLCKSTSPSTQHHNTSAMQCH